ncbi:MAG: NAD-dependent dihydropyrimidine dehydrogenase subunit PreA [Erysipelotrichaceae bacterium]|nr:NAD-dependent dihydropyrimidine dehydrogenase subunit PreA [Erysipelotrichaceae bacterium]
MYNYDYKKCLMCYDAPCSKACGRVDIEKMMRAFYLDDFGYAFTMLEKCDTCEFCDGICTNACLNGIDIRKMVIDNRQYGYLYENLEGYEDIDISSDICGVKLENPFILSSSCVGASYDMIARAFDMGWAGVSYKTISMMDMYEASPRYSAVKDDNIHIYGFKNIEQLSSHSVEENIETISLLKKNYPDKVVIASIMGRNEAEWEYLSRKVSEAGADVIELNFSCPNMEEKNTGSDIGQNPEWCKKFMKAAKKGATVPVIAKLTPNIQDITVPGLASIEGGADGLSAINTIKSITGVDLDTKVALPAVGTNSMVGGYSGPAVKPIALRQISELSRNEVINKKHISGIGGIETWEDAVEFMMLGAGSVQMTTSVMQYGYRIIEDLINGLKIFMKQKGYTPVYDFIGAAVSSIVENDEINRDTMVYPTFIDKYCHGCGRCHIACNDAGHQAMMFDKETRKPKLDGTKCVGCMLCSLVCPGAAIVPSKRFAKKENRAVKELDPYI